MVRSKFEDVVDAVRDGAPQYAVRAGKAFDGLREDVEDAFGDAAPRARRMKRRIKQAVTKRMESVDRAGRDNAFIMAVGALGMGLLIGYLIAKDSD